MIIAVDPSYTKNIGISWLDQKGIHFNSIVLDKADKDLDTRDLQHIAFKVFSFICGLNPQMNSILAVEGQFFGVNKIMTMRLIEVRALLQGMVIAKYPSMKVVTVNPISWQSKVLNAYKIKSEEIKKLSIKYASDLTGKKVTEDESDAICILKYIEKNGNK